jgi:hypothetical protein
MEAGLKPDLPLLGEGAYRRAFRLSNVVYKVDYWSAHDGSTNQDEWETMLRARAMGYGKYLPPVDLWYVPAGEPPYTFEVPVLALPYYEKSMNTVGHSLYEQAWRIVESLPRWMRWDAGGDNIRFTPKGRIRLTDLQSS